MARRALLLALVLMAVSLAGPHVPTALADECPTLDCEISGNQNAQAIEGRVIIPATGFDGDWGIRQEAVTCGGCAWAITPSCDDNDEETTNGCSGFLSRCPAPSLRYDVLRRGPGETGFRFVASTCIEPGAPMTVDDITPQVRDRFLDRLPPQQPSFQPAAGALVNVPALFAAGQPASIGEDAFDLAGMDVVVSARATWTWDFGDGSVQDFTQPGGPYPNTDVAHTYATSEDRTVVLTTTWEGTYTVDGLGPFAVDGAPVTQVSAPIALLVRGARSELVAGG